MNKSKHFIILLILCFFINSCSPSFVQPSFGNPESETATQVLPSSSSAIPTNTIQPSATATEQPTKRPSATAWNTPTPGTTPAGGSEWLLFSVSERKAEQYVGMGVYIFNLARQEIQQLYGEGYSLQDVSPDGKWILVNQGNLLFLTGLFGENPILLSENFETNTGKTAQWSVDGQTLMWIERVGAQTSLIITDALAMSPAVVVEALPHAPLMLYSSSETSQIIWKAGACSDLTDCTSGVWISDLPGQQSNHYPEINFPEVNQQGLSTALLQTGEISTLTLFSSLAFSEGLPLDVDEDYPAAVSFSPINQSAAVLAQVRSDYSGRNFGNRVLIFSAPDWKAVEIGSVEGLNGKLAWGPDGQHLLIMTTSAQDSGYAIHLWQLEIQSAGMQSLTEFIDISAESFIFVSNMIWVR